MTQKRITQKDVADRAGLNRATVSLALRDHPSIAISTRERVQKIAAEMGYTPDPMLSALAAYRNGSREHGFRGNLGWIAMSTRHFRWREKGHFTRYLAGAEAKAQSLGYTIQVVDVGELGIRWERVASILRAQGIQGLLLCPQEQPDTRIDRFPWEDFSTVKFGNSITVPQVQAVAPAQFRASQRVVSELKSRGYQRIGFVGQRSHDERTGHNYFGGCLSELAFERWDRLVAPFWFSHGGEEELIAWYERERPDAIVGSMEYYYEVLKRRGYDAPRDFGFACPATGEGAQTVSGIREADERIGGAAVEMVVAMIQRSERGTSEYPQRLLVEGNWEEGTTVRKPTPNAPKARRAKA